MPETLLPVDEGLRGALRRDREGRQHHGQKQKAYGDTEGGHRDSRSCFAINLRLRLWFTARYDPGQFVVRDGVPRPGDQISHIRSSDQAHAGLCDGTAFGAGPMGPTHRAAGPVGPSMPPRECRLLVSRRAQDRGARWN